MPAGANLHCSIKKCRTVCWMFELFWARRDTFITQAQQACVQKSSTISDWKCIHFLFYKQVIVIMLFIQLKKLACLKSLCKIPNLTFLEYRYIIYYRQFGFAFSWFAKRVKSIRIKNCNFSNYFMYYHTTAFYHKSILYRWQEVVNILAKIIAFKAAAVCTSYRHLNNVKRYEIFYYNKVSGRH